MKVWRLGNDVDTDVLAPGAYMKLDLPALSVHCLESVRADFGAQVQAGDVLVAGENFGIGSSREQAASVLVHLGIRAVIAPSFSGLYFRNAFNVGLLLLTCPRADEILESDQLELVSGQPYKVVVKRSQKIITLPCANIPEFLLEMVNEGGLLNLLRRQQRGAKTAIK
jgi:3-isopropylmalate/(R)-2-methylmalate dehydratase small subunit